MTIQAKRPRRGELRAGPEGVAAPCAAASSALRGRSPRHRVARFLRALGLLALLALSGTAAASSGTFPTTLVVSSSPNPAVFDQFVVFHVAVYAAGTQAVLAGGTLDLYDNGTFIGTTPVSGGASDHVFTASVGTHTLLANYSGDGLYAGSSGTLIQVVNPNTSVAISASPQPSVYGQNVGISATVVAVPPAIGTPTGSVNFSAVYNALVPPKVVSLGNSSLVQGVATLTTVALPAGSATIQADYVSDNPAVYSSSTAQAAQTVNADHTTTTLSQSSNPSVSGQTVTFTVNVAPTAPGLRIPSGTATLSDGATVLATLPLDASGNAAFPTSTLSFGSHSVSASFAPDNDSTTGAADFVASSSNALTHTVNADATTTSLTSSPGSQIAGRPVTFTAKVSANAPGSGTPTGTVTFKDGTTTLGIQGLTNGMASLTTSSLSAGSHSITATYNGATAFNPGTSGVLTETIGSNTTVAFAASPSTSVVGQNVTFTATVTGIAPCAAPTGTVTFTNLAGSPLGSAALSPGSGTSAVATASLPVVQVGTQSIFASYAGSGACTSSAARVTQQVNRASSVVAVVSSANPSTHGQAVTLSATIGVAAPGALVQPTGMVTFLDGAVTLGTAMLSNANASITTSALSVGTHAITATYAGDSNVTAGTGALNPDQTVNAAPGVLAISAAGPAFAQYGKAVSYTIQVTNVGEQTVDGLVADSLPPQIVSSSAIWTCTATGGAQCNSGLAGDLNDSVTIPAGAEVAYALSATLDVEGSISSDTFTHTAAALDRSTNVVVSAPMTTTLVVFRDTFGGGAAAAAPDTPAVDLRPGGEPVDIPLDIPDMDLGQPTLVASGADASGELLRVEALRPDATRVLVRLVTTEARVEQAGAWFEADAATLSLARSDDGRRLIVGFGQSVRDLPASAGPIDLHARAR